MKKIKSKWGRFALSFFVASLFKIIELLIICVFDPRAASHTPYSNALFFCVELIAARIIVDLLFEPADEK